MDPLPLPLYHWFTQVRGLTRQDIEQFKNWKFAADLPWNDIPDLRLGAQRLALAIEQGQRIGIYGDYDVDGATSCALLYWFLQLFNLTPELYQPGRLEEGYGLHISSIERAVQDQLDLLITVDCGISSIAAAQRARELNLDLIITDHHQDVAPEPVVALAVINPNRRDAPKDSPWGILAGVGVAFALALNTRELLIAQGRQVPSLYPLLTWVAIGTISDLAALSGVNSLLCKHGLKQLPTTSYCGLKPFLAYKGLSRHYLDSEYISFFIGPMINSKGRLDHPRAALELLTCSDEKRVNQLFDQLLDSNMERKQVQKKLLKEAQLEWLTQEESQWPKAIILAQEQWHEGVIGIAASQLVQTYQRPTIVLAPSTQDPQMWKGSGRTWGNLHLLELLQDYRHFFEKFGGHRAAAGLSIRREQLEPFKQALLQDPRLELIEHRTLPPLELPLSSIGPEFINQLWSLAPFGQGHPLPHLKLKECRLEKFQKLTGGHVKWTFSALSPSLQQISGISFYRDLAPQRFLTDPQYFMDRQQHQQLRIVGKLQLNIFAQREQWQLLVEELYFEEELSLAREQHREATGP